MNGTRLVHEGRIWLEDAGLMHLVDDPYTREEIIAVVDANYPRRGDVKGIEAFRLDRGFRTLPRARMSLGGAAKAKRKREREQAARIERLKRLAPGARVEPGATVESRR